MLSPFKVLWKFYRRVRHLVLNNRSAMHQQIDEFYSHIIYSIQPFNWPLRKGLTQRYTYVCVCVYRWKWLDSEQMKRKVQTTRECNSFNPIVCESIQIYICICVWVWKQWNLYMLLKLAIYMSYMFTYIEASIQKHILKESLKLFLK